MLTTELRRRWVGLTRQGDIGYTEIQLLADEGFDEDDYISVLKEECIRDIVTERRVIEVVEHLGWVKILNIVDFTGSDNVTRLWFMRKLIELVNRESVKVTIQGVEGVVVSYLELYTGELNGESYGTREIIRNLYCVLDIIANLNQCILTSSIEQAIIEYVTEAQVVIEKKGKFIGRHPEIIRAVGELADIYKLNVIGKNLVKLHCRIVGR